MATASYMIDICPLAKQVFGMLQYVHCIHHGLMFNCPPIFACSVDKVLNHGCALKDSSAVYNES